MSDHKYDSTAAMASAWFGTSGCGPAIERVFGISKEERINYLQGMLDRRQTLTEYEYAELQKLKGIDGRK